MGSVSFQFHLQLGPAYHTYCFVCHGAEAIAGGTPPDLRAITPETRAQWSAIVQGGMHWEKGMVGFSEVLSKDDSDNILAYVTAQAITANKKD